MSAKKLITLILSVLVLCSSLLGLSACTSPEDSFKEIEKQSFENAMANVYAALEATPEQTHSAGTTTVSVELSDSVMSLLDSTGVDFSWLNDTEIRYTSETDGSLLRGYADLVLGEDSLLSLEAIADGESGEAYLLLPQLTKKYLELSDLVDLGTATTVDTEEAMSLIKGYLAWVQKYYFMLIDGIPTVQKTKGSLEANGITQACTVYDVSFTEKQIYTLTRDVLVAFKEDEEFKQLLDDAIEFARSIDPTVEVPEDTYETMLEEVDDAIQQIEDEYLSEDADESVNDIVFTVTAYVDKKDILGHRIWLSDREDEYDLFAATAKAGNETGYELSLSNTEGELFSLIGLFTNDGKAIEGSLELSVEEKSMLFVDVVGLDSVQYKNGYFNGKLSLAFGEDLWETVMSEAQDAALANISLAGISFDFDITSSENVSEVTISVVNGKATLGSVTTKVEITEAGEIELPSAAKTDDPDEWMANADFDAYFEYLLNDTDLPDDIVFMIQSLLFGGLY